MSDIWNAARSWDQLKAERDSLREQLAAVEGERDNLKANVEGFIAPAKAEESRLYTETKLKNRALESSLAKARALIDYERKADLPFWVSDLLDRISSALHPAQEEGQG